MGLSIPDYAEGGLSRADGALQMVVSSTTALPACDGVERSAKVAMTLLPGTFELGAEGAVDVVTVGAVLTVDAPRSASVRRRWPTTAPSCRRPPDRFQPTETRPGPEAQRGFRAGVA